MVGAEMGCTEKPVARGFHQKALQSLRGVQEEGCGGRIWWQRPGYL